jgi:signal peptidase I
VWAGFLSLLLPGLGQVCAGAWRLGSALLGVNVLLLAGLSALTGWTAPTPPAAALGLLWLAVIPLFHIGCAIHAIRLRWRGTARRRRNAFVPTLAAAVIAIAVSAAANLAVPFAWRSFYTASTSMVPTLLPGEMFLVDIRPMANLPPRGAVVAFSLPAQPDTVLVKRLVGLPGDTIALRDGHLTVNGEMAERRPDGTFELDGRALPRFVETLPHGPSYGVIATGQEPRLNSMAPVAVPSGHVFVVGDSRDNSLDSRTFGTVPAAFLIGRVYTIVWSPSAARLLRPVP